MSGEHNFEAFAKMYHNDKLAEVAECHKTTIYAYKKGKPIPSDIVIRIADHYKVSTDKVLGRVLPAEALTKENFPNARPNVAFTVSQKQIDHAKENRELKFNREILRKQIAELEQQLTERTVERDNIAADRDHLIERCKSMSERYQHLDTEERRKQEQTTIAQDSATLIELRRLRNILQSIHFLSEEK